MCLPFKIQAKPPYTQEQLIDKAIMAIQRTGLYETALLEWQGFDEVNKTWQQLKLHFEEAYEIRLASGRGSTQSLPMNPYLQEFQYRSHMLPSTRLLEGYSWLLSNLGYQPYLLQI